MLVPATVSWPRQDITAICEMAYFTPIGFANVPAMNSLDKLAEITSLWIERPTLECDGSEAVETAIKLASITIIIAAIKTSFMILSRRAAYHGVNGIG